MRLRSTMLSNCWFSGFRCDTFFYGSLRNVIITLENIEVPYLQVIYGFEFVLLFAIFHIFTLFNSGRHSHLCKPTSCSCIVLQPLLQAFLPFRAFFFKCVCVVFWSSVGTNANRVVRFYHFHKDLSISNKKSMVNMVFMIK